MEKTIAIKHYLDTSMTLQRREQENSILQVSVHSNQNRVITVYCLVLFKCNVSYQPAFVMYFVTRAALDRKLLT